MNEITHPFARPGTTFYILDDIFWAVQAEAKYQHRERTEQASWRGELYLAPKGGSRSASVRRDYGRDLYCERAELTCQG